MQLYANLLVKGINIRFEYHVSDFADNYQIEKGQKHLMLTKFIDTIPVYRLIKKGKKKQIYLDILNNFEEKSNFLIYRLLFYK